jgi:hypothetical protein
VLVFTISLENQFGKAFWGKSKKNFVTEFYLEKNVVLSIKMQFDYIAISFLICISYAKVFFNGSEVRNWQS